MSVHQSVKRYNLECSVLLLTGQINEAPVEMVLGGMIYIYIYMYTKFQGDRFWQSSNVKVIASRI